MGNEPPEMVGSEDNEPETEYEEDTYFVGCTCEHDPEQHGWSECDIEGCPCEGGWVE